MTSVTMLRSTGFRLLALLLFFNAGNVSAALDLLRAVPASLDFHARIAAQAPSEHPLDIDFALLSSGLITTGAVVRVEPVPGVVFTANVTRVGTDINNVFFMYARIDAHPYADLSLSVDAGLALGTIMVPSEKKQYTIRYHPPGAVHVARQVLNQELDELPTNNDAVPVPPPTSGDDAMRMNASSPAHAEAFVQSDPNAPATVDLLVVYTPAARTWANSFAGSINSVINQAVVIRGQTALDNSQVGITLNLIHSAEINYVEDPNNSLQTLERLRVTNDGHMDDVHSLRDTHGADVVAILAQVNDTGGLGYALASWHLPGGMPTHAFSLTRVQQAASGYTLIHEIGHNMGAGHHRDQNVQAGPQLFSYSAGHRWTSYCTIMAYESGYPDAQTHSRIPYFSNPSVSYLGTPTGNATLADNARTLRETKHITAAYRASTAPPPAGVNIEFRATPLNDRVFLRWNDPQTHGYGSSTVHIRFSTTAYPASTSQGTLVYQGTNQSIMHTSGIVSGQPHYYTIWVSNNGSTFFEP